MISFYEYLSVINEGKTFGKTGLYPLGYQGIGQYPPAYLIPQSADAIYYISADDRLQHYWEKSPFKIDHIKPSPVFTKPQGKKLYVAAKANMPPGEVVEPKEPTLGGNIIPYKYDSHPCIEPDPKVLDPKLCGKAAEKSRCMHIWTNKMPD